MTWGYGNEPPSVVNIEYEIQGVTVKISWQTWSILPFVDTRLMEAFQVNPSSENGNSGSEVFDLEGRVSGLLLGGSTPPLAVRHDITYSMPMKWLQRVSARKLSLVLIFCKKGTFRAGRI
jgi:S1-C subfamily serine protease